MEPSIKIEGLTKFYGKKQALRDINMEIGPGMYGLLGRNGAGKTTLMRILATLLPKTGGNVEVCDVPVEKAAKVRPLVGYLPQEFSLYPGMKVVEAMDYLGVLSGLTKAQRQQRIPALLAEVNLQDAAGLRVKALSGGMKRRLGIAQALLHEPSVLIVDEPTAGLDPEERVRFRNLLCQVAEGRVVLLSTHIVEDIEKTCENIALLRAGELVYTGTLAAFVEGQDGLENAYMRVMGADLAGEAGA